MEIRVLRYFLEVARERSVTHAAERLHISQPTLSKQLTDLESELGKKLFVRSSFSVRLTDEGDAAAQAGGGHSGHGGQDSGGVQSAG